MWKTGENPYLWMNIHGPDLNKTTILHALSAAVYSPRLQSLILTNNFQANLFSISENGKHKSHVVDHNTQAISLVPNSEELYYADSIGNIVRYHLSTELQCVIASLPNPSKALIAVGNKIYVTINDAILRVDSVSGESFAWAGQFDHLGAKRVTSSSGGGGFTRKFRDGCGQDAQLNDPHGICQFGGQLLVADFRNDVVRIVEPAQDYLNSLLQWESPFDMFPPGILPIIASYYSAAGIVRTYPAWFWQPTDVVGHLSSGKAWVVDEIGLHVITFPGSTSKMCCKLVNQHTFVRRRLAIAEGKWLFISEYAGGNIYKIPWSDLMRMSI